VVTLDDMAKLIERDATRSGDDEQGDIAAVAFDVASKHYPDSKDRCVTCGEEWLRLPDFPGCSLYGEWKAIAGVEIVAGVQAVMERWKGKQ
jgi:hypothetical protein